MNTLQCDHCGAVLSRKTKSEWVVLTGLKIEQDRSPCSRHYCSDRCMRECLNHRDRMLIAEKADQDAPNEVLNRIFRGQVDGCIFCGTVRQPKKSAMVDLRVEAEFCALVNEACDRFLQNGGKEAKRLYLGREQAVLAFKLEAETAFRCGIPPMTKEDQSRRVYAGMQIFLVDTNYHMEVG